MNSLFDHDEVAGAERAWALEIERRTKELEADEVETIPAEEVFEELDGLLQ